MSTLIKHIIQQYQDIQNGKLWMGDSFEKKFNKMDESLVFTRPVEGMHSVAELISHLTFWRKDAIVKLETGRGIKSDDDPENWLNNEALKQQGWAHIKSEYDSSLSDLIELLKSKEDAFLDEEYYDADFKGNYPNSYVINGLLHHDIYHLGQIGIVIKYLNKE